VIEWYGEKEKKTERTRDSENDLESIMKGHFDWGWAELNCTGNIVCISANAAAAQKSIIH